MFHEWIALAIFIVLAIGGLGLSLVGISGTWLVVIAAGLYNLISWSTTISLNIFLWLAGLAIIGELLEWIITYVGIKAYKVSKYGLIGTVLGAIAGGMLLSLIPIIGTIIGLLAGGMLGAFIAEYYHTINSKKAWRAAKAALIGRIIVMATKFTLTIVQIMIISKLIF